MKDIWGKKPNFGACNIDQDLEDGMIYDIRWTRWSSKSDTKAILYHFTQFQCSCTLHNVRLRVYTKMWSPSREDA